MSVRRREHVVDARVVGRLFVGVALSVGMAAGVGLPATAALGEAPEPGLMVSSVDAVRATSWEGAYDGDFHGIGIDADEGVVVEYSEYAIGPYSSAVPQYRNVGLHEVFYRGLDGQGSVVSEGSATVNITPLTVRLSWFDTDFTYDGGEHVPVAKVEGLLSGDRCRVVVDGKATDAGGHVATATSLTNGNYVLPDDPTCEFSIAQKPVGVSWNDTRIGYDGGAHTPEAVLAGVLSGDDCEPTVVGSGVTVGTYVAKVTGLSNSNYRLLGSANTKFDIVPRVLELEWGESDFVYDGETHAPGVSLANVVDGDKCRFAVSGEGRKAGTYVRTVSGISNPNYVLPDDPTCKFTIAKRVVDLSWSDTSFGYDAASHVPRVKVGNVVDGENCSVRVVGDAVDAGEHVARVEAIANANYALPKDATCKFKIAKAQLTIKAKNKKIRVGKKAANAGVTYSGLKGKDGVGDLSGKLKYSYGKYKRGSGEGVYPIVPRGLSSKNYDITYKKGKLRVVAPKRVGVTASLRFDDGSWKSGKNGSVAGKPGTSQTATGVKIKLGKLPYSGSLAYRIHLQDNSWDTPWFKGGQVAEMSNHRFEAIEMRLKGKLAKHYDVYYRVCSEMGGWLGWAKNGKKAGTAGFAKRATAMQVVILKKGSKAPGANYKGVKRNTKTRYFTMYNDF